MTADLVQILDHENLEKVIEWVMIDTVNALTEQAFGYSVWGYWKFHNEDDAHEIMGRNGGFAGQLNWYKAAVRNIKEDDAKIPKEHIVQSAPTLVIVSDEDYVTRADVAYLEAPKLLRNFEIKKFEGCGHWIPLEKRDELSEALIKFADGLEANFEQPLEGMRQSRRTWK
ncbi:hypothetical protein DID88_003202 [Monilinia fructigena]|uniref:AB hydrolase-1 domain-containing protein n=1 Tax=Monilinia fructigena TaxID=38457 RepID=A0A395IVW7_9HELO|nr:hypothetical protein DID88_003202 [Monilinia fructigena]